MVRHARVSTGGQRRRPAALCIFKRGIHYRRSLPQDALRTRVLTITEEECSRHKPCRSPKIRSVGMMFAHKLWWC
ncbi:hypothetical protein BAUCODRAFT_513833 [Baudoinia panamericana UAMH 10762]|uniref:Uncharacterized protein n=1 Tax=Baudoinia panamericana (strain UAMH 10762) TaxID=717646 RepID=M2NB12_BAUPA|nr:uncharacterized protein BAUCODRAFT_513833 [Baudoinia panamericana UAMH 10762]EMC96025.1 hypothetical protein BAUCODRAFT_513833 [Baudoinia panamericana UAMH 10762]